MILRRIASAFRKQDWFTVLIETLIVVFGVFIGLQVNNWNEARKYEATRQVILQGLQSDFANLATAFDDSIVRAVALFEDSEKLLKLLSAEEPPTTDELGSLPIVLWSYTPLPSGSPTYVELLSSGELHRLDHRDLRDALIRYENHRTYYRELLTEIRTSFTAEAGHMRAVQIGSTEKDFSDWDEFRYSVEPLKERLFEVNFAIFSSAEQLEFLKKMDAEVELILTLLEADL